MVSSVIEVSVNETHGCGNVSAGNSLDWCIKVVKSFALNDLGANFAANTESWEAAFYNDKATYI